MMNGVVVYSLLPKRTIIACLSPKTWEATERAESEQRNDNIHHIIDRKQHCVPHWCVPLKTESAGVLYC